MTHRTIDEQIQHLVESLRPRLAAGASEYGDRSYDRHAHQHLAEIREEILDICGWSAILLERLRRLEERGGCPSCGAS